MGRDSLQCMLTGAVLVDQVGNVKNTCYNARFFKPIYLTHSTPLSILFGRSIHEVALSLSFLLRQLSHNSFVIANDDIWKSYTFIIDIYVFIICFRKLL